RARQDRRRSKPSLSRGPCLPPEAQERDRRARLRSRSPVAPPPDRRRRASSSSASFSSLVLHVQPIVMFRTPHDSATQLRSIGRRAFAAAPPLAPHHLAFHAFPALALRRCELVK